MNSSDKNGIYFTQYKNETWELPKKVPFIETDKKYNNDVPIFSLDGERLYFLSDRPFDNYECKKRIWYTFLENGLWIKPKLLEKIEPDIFMLHWQFSISNNGTFYFTGIRKDGYGAYDIYKAELLNSKYVDQDCCVRNGVDTIPVGLEGMKQHVINVRKTYPDLKISIVHLHDDKDFIISEIITEGTHLGEWLGIKPSGKKFVFTGVNIDRIQNNKIIEHGGAANVFDTLWSEKIIQAST